jgi:hypothetical protein
MSVPLKTRHMIYLQLGCFQFRAAQMSGENDAMMIRRRPAPPRVLYTVLSTESVNVLTNAMEHERSACSAAEHIANSRHSPMCTGRI